MSGLSRLMAQASQRLRQPGPPATRFRHHSRAEEACRWGEQGNQAHAAALAR